MEMMPVKPERKAQLEDYAQRHGQDAVAALFLIIDQRQSLIGQPRGAKLRSGRRVVHQDIQPISSVVRWSGTATK